MLLPGFLRTAVAKKRKKWIDFTHGKWRPITRQHLHCRYNINLICMLLSFVCVCVWNARNAHSKLRYTWMECFWQIIGTFSMSEGDEQICYGFKVHFCTILHNVVNIKWFNCMTNCLRFHRKRREGRRTWIWCESLTYLERFFWKKVDVMDEVKELCTLRSRANQIWYILDQYSNLLPSPFGSIEEGREAMFSGTLL